MAAAASPSPEASARTILGILKSFGCRPGDVVVAGQINAMFITNGGRAKDYDAGMKHANDSGWIETASTAAIRLTDAGFAEM